MKKSTIWMLATVMGFAFAGLLYLQVSYISIIMKTSNEQFDTTVRRCLEKVSGSIERDEVYRYLEEDIKSGGNSFMYKSPPNQMEINQKITQSESYQLHVQNANGSIQHIELNRFSAMTSAPSKNTIIRASEEQQKKLLKRYEYQAGVIDDVLYSMIYTPNLKPIDERVDFKVLNNYIKSELISSGLNIPYIFSVVNKDGVTIYQNEAYEKPPKAADVVTHVLFPNDPPSKWNYLKIYFPTKRDYISSSVTFLVPSVLFSFILMVTFITTIYIIFRQKRLSEMKNDFVNNMTHELKTPVSTISLAAQMLRDTDITKSPDVFKHISGVINDETKRLGFLVEKVLQMSLFEKQKATLKLKEVDANDLLVGIVSTFALKVDKYGGTIDVDLQAEDSSVYIDEMHITNVLFNLLDNAVKYRRKDVPLELMARTRSENGKLIISIEDNGIGIKKEHLKKVFDRFYRVPTGNVHDVKGFGLGLAYVRKMVEDHGGTIRAEQQQESGTRFIITLPLIKN
ncbi:sensor histidine kinase [Tannerella forsythia]|uniref:sensor histidine kinase n=1 Tax=Tannerella forsythia TaxID=28112 RepID=UPI00062B0FFC|nr:HAMP domain-containing sensor histidine kinase [Tannerella forsythia]KKY62123.1 histidine kinase [Tannerella forsythia]TPE15555.1 HAMP domain-containing histidine kinase [Tannerella forsythia]